ncbi:MAG: DUF6288 domain-containing protein [Akkermansiaceae bacterium]|nr:DUF6288 domain-containing protein [Akkermansiaceae bacterium]
MKKTVIPIVALLVTAHSWVLAEPEWRTFTSSTGVKLEARVVSVDETEVVLVRKSDGKTFTVPLRRLSEEDQEFLRDYEPTDADAEEMPEEPDGPRSFEKIESSVPDYFPDLTVGKKDSQQHFPLGPLGGVIAVAMESNEAEILSLAPDGPASKAGLESGDRIIAAGGRKFAPLSPDEATGGDGVPRQLGLAILAAQAEGTPLLLEIKRSGEKIEIPVELPRMPDFDDFSKNCTRSAALSQAACHWLAATYAKSGNFGNGDSYSNAFAAIALLASGNPEYRGIIRQHAERVASLLESKVDDNNWRSAAMGIFLAEYHLATGDESVLEAIKACCEALGERIHPDNGRLGHSGTELPYEQKGLVITSGHAHLLWALASHCGIELDAEVWDLSYRSIKASIGEEGNVGYNFSLTVSEQSMARTGITATALEVADKSSGDRRGMFRWIKENYKRATNGHTVTSMGLIFGFMGQTNGDARGLLNSLDYHRFVLALCSPVDPAQGAYYYGVRTNFGGDGYLGFRTVGNYTTAMILHSVRKDTLWSFGNREKSWYR